MPVSTVHSILRNRIYTGWFEWNGKMIRMYHRKDGKVQKIDDDLMAATRYGIMMLRHAACQKGYGFNRKLTMQPLGIV